MDLLLTRRGTVSRSVRSRSPECFDLACLMDLVPWSCGSQFAHVNRGQFGSQVLCKI